MAKGLIAVALLVSLMPAAALQPRLADAACDTAANPIQCENLLVGDDPSTWDIPAAPGEDPDAGDPSIQGYATDISVNKGATVHFKINTPATAYTIDIYRMGYYAGKGARKWGSATPSAALPQAQPACLKDATGLVDCGNWAESASWIVPSTAVSGIYFAKLRRTDTGGISHIHFVVRDDASTSPLLFQTSDETWQAYNSYGGSSLYRDFAGNNTLSPTAGRAFKVSYNRPFNTRSTIDFLGNRSFVWSSEYPMVRFLEANGFNVAYQSGVDTERAGAAGLQQHRTFLSVGHDEYWSGGQRAAVEAARDAGVNLAFFSGNQMFWKTRWENSIDGANTQYRTLVTYKETHANAKIDPTPTWTGTFRDPRFSPDGGKPENAVAGQIFTVNGPVNNAMTIPEAMGKLRLWRNTPNVATLAANAVYTVTAGCSCILGHEWDEDLDNGSRPAGLIRMSATTANVPFYIQDYGNTYTPGTATHALTLYRAPSNALVFGAGTVQWSWALDATHDGMGSATDLNIQQATINLFADMGAQAATPQAGLSAATASTDVTRPLPTTITAPANGASLPNGTPVDITGTASDTGGSPVGKVAGVEVSIDGGTTWHPAQGTTNWKYTFTPGNPGTAMNIRARAIDDSANIENAGPGINVTISPRSCDTDVAPCSIWHSSATPKIASNADIASTEVGVKFYSEQGGYIKGLRFYRGPNNPPPSPDGHRGTVWTITGTKLGSATFLNETATGWQQANFPTPILIAAGQTYVASYHAPQGGYAVDQEYFKTSGVDNFPLHALQDGENGGNGVFENTQNPFFPTLTFNSSNYWVDVVFSLNATDPNPPTVASTSPSANATSAPVNSSITASFNESVVESSINFVLRENGTNALVSSTFDYDENTLQATLIPQGPLRLGTSYTASVLAAVDTQGVAMVAPANWTFSTPTCPCSIFTPTDGPALGDVDRGDASALTLGMRFKPLVDGVVTGVEFYKGATNVGTHVGALWNSTGTQLASVTFGAETASGWQTAMFSSPVAVTANTDYIVSYFAPQGHYSGTVGNFNTLDRSVGPLLAAHNTVSAPNGVFGVGNVFPASTFQATNYWVDVIFDAGANTSPVITSNPQTTATDLTPTTATIKWTTDRASDSLVEYGTSAGYGSFSIINPTMLTQHSVALTGLQSGTTYHYRVVSRTSAGGLLVSGDFTFTTVVLADTTPPVITSGPTATAVDAQSEKISWSTDENSTSVAEYGLNNAYGSTASPQDNSPTKTHVVTLSSLTPSTEYHYRVKSTDASGNVVTSAESTFVTNNLKISQVIAQVPAGEPGETSAEIGWTTDANSDSQVEYGLTTSYGSSTPVDDDLDTTHTVVVPGLTPTTTYHYRVKSKAQTGPTIISGDFTFKTNAPKILNVVETPLDGRTVRVTWGTAAPSTSQIEYGTAPTLGTLTPLDSALVTAHTITIGGLLPGTTYYYRILSRDTGGVLSSLTDTFTTPADGTPPAFVAGSIKAQSLTANSATIVWRTTEASDSQVDYGTTTSYGSSSPLNTTKVIDHSVNLPGLNSATTYHFRVNSRDATGNLATSPDFSFTTLTTPRSLSLNGTTAYAEAPHASEVNVLNDWTIEAWFKDESQYGYFHLPATIISKGDELRDTDMPYSIGITFNALYVTEKSGGQLSYMYYNLATNKVPANSWHHVAVTMKGSTRQATIYLDGVQVMQGTLSRITTVGNTKPVSIGRNGGPTGLGLWKGKLDDVRIWNVVRTSAQVSANYRSQLIGAQSGLVANWKVDEGTGSTAADSATIPENATLTGGATFSPDVH